MTQRPFSDGVAGGEGDDGRADPRLSAALSATAADPECEPDLWQLLPTARFLVAVLPVASGAPAENRGGRTESGSEQGTDMALVSVGMPDGRRVLPAFSGLAGLSRWNAAARPVPVAGPRLARAALEEELVAVVIDPGEPGAYVLAGAPLRALAAGRTPLPASRDPDVLAVIASAVRDQQELSAASVHVEAGELVVDVQPSGGVGDLAARAAAQRLAQRLAADPLLRARLDRPLRLALAAGGTDQRSARVDAS